MVKAEPGLLNQFCGATPLQKAAFIFPHTTLPGKHLDLYAIFTITEFQSFIYLVPPYLNAEAEGTSLG